MGNTQEENKSITRTRNSCSGAVLYRKGFWFKLDSLDFKSPKLGNQLACLQRLTASHYGHLICSIFKINSNGEDWTADLINLALYELGLPV